MAQPIILPSFGAGELAPSMYGRVDLAKYHVGAALLRNYFVDYRGGASSRTGTQFVGAVADSTTPNRLIPFQFNTLQTYALVFGNKTLRFVTNGGYVLDGSGNIYQIATPYAATDLALLKFTQSADTMTLVHPSYAPQKLTRQGNAAWTIAPITFQPIVAAPTGVSATFQNAGTGTAYPNTQYGYVVTATVNGIESLPSAAAYSTSYALGQNVGAQNKVAWNSVASATIYNIYRTQENLGTTVPQGALFGYIGSANPAAVNTFIDDNILPDFTHCPPQGYNPFLTAGNPGCVTYYQQRQVFGGMSLAPEQIDFSKSGDFFNMDYSIPSQPNDNIEITIASQQVNAIKHMLPMQSLIALTSSGAWKIDAGNVGTALTPSQIQAVPQVYNGCSDVPPLIINYDILYVQAKGSIVRDLSYNFYVNVYTGTDVTILANHLFYGHQITEWCYAEEPFKIVWAVRDDGILLSLTYLKEQDVCAWAHHDTQGLFKSICTVSEGNENAVYVIVERFINGQYLQYIERFASRQMGGDPTIGLPADPTRAWCVDAGLQYPLTMPNATLTPVATDAVPVIYGVHVIGGGQNYSAQTVINVVDDTGSGAVLTPVIVGGVITGVAIVPGSGWTNPTLTVFDPTGAGSGAALSAILASPVVMNASAPVLGSVKVGDVVRINGGVGAVLSVQNASQMTVNITRDLTSAWPATSGNWSVTTPVQTVSGLSHLNGQTVSILADGNVAPQQVVKNGSITLDRAYSAITVGLPFTCQLQSLYVDVQEAGGTIQSKRKTIPAVTVRMQDSRGLKAGPTFDSLVEIKERTTEPMGQPIQLFTGDQRIVLPARYNVPGQICIQQDYPLPSTILALIPELVVGDN
jgi:hypothetical protein